MTELYIAGQLVVLPESFSITIIEENPFFTKNGKYSYDITLSLLDPINARIYKHLNRVNNKAVLPKNRTAYLVVDNEVVLNGTEVILEHTDKEVKIQLLSGNSELNFLIGGDRKLRDLNLGEADVYKSMTQEQRARQVFQDLKKSYPDRDWQFIPYCINEEDVNIYSNFDNFFINVGNNYIIPEYNFDDGDGRQIYPNYRPLFSGAVPQPYLCFIIECILESLGYDLIYNAIAEHKVLKDIYIVHAFRTTFFAKMLPSWTVVEFFTKIEQWLNCVFIIDPYDKTVRLMFSYQADDKGNIETLESIDEFVVETDNDNEKTVINSNIRYDLDSEEYYKYMALSDFVKRKSKEKETQSLENLIIQNEETIGDFEYIYKPKDTEDRFIAYRKNEEGDRFVRTLKKVDSFRALYNNTDSEEIDIDIDIIPAPMKYTYLNVYLYYNYEFWIQMPIASEGDPLLEINTPGEVVPDVDTIDIQTAVENDTSVDAEKTYSKMRVAIYSGLQEMDVKLLGSIPLVHNRYPLAYVEALSEYFEETKKPRYFGSKDVNPFRFSYLQKEIYQKSMHLDNSSIFKIDFINNGRKDITAKYIIKNKAFRCVKTERIVTDKGFNEIVKGEFYPYT